MSFKVTHYCDNSICKRLIPDEEMATLKAEVSKIVAAGQYTQADATQTIQEVFCSDCLPHAAAYWDGKRAILKDAVSVLERRLGNHAKQFWASKQARAKLQAVGAAK